MKAKQEKRDLLDGGKFHIGRLVWLSIRVAPVACMSWLLLQTVTSMSSAIIALATAKFIESAMAVYAGQAGYAGLIAPLAVIFGIMVVIQINRAGRSFLITAYTNRLTLRVRSAQTRRIAAIDFYLFEDSDNRDMIRRATSRMETYIKDSFLSVVDTAAMAVQLVSLAGVLGAYLWWAGFAYAAVCLPVLFGGMIVGKKRYQADREIDKLNRRAGAYGGTLMGRDNVEERNLFGYGPAMQGKWLERAQTAAGIDGKNDAKNAGVQSLIIAMAVVATGVLLCILLGQVAAGALAASLLIGMIGPTIEFVISTSWWLAWVSRRFTQTKEYIKDLNAFCDLRFDPAVLEMPEPIPGFVLESIVFENVSFTYPGMDRLVLDGVNLRIQGGEHCAIVGVNGAGKTTLVKLLYGLYDNYEGNIYINGKERREYKKCQLTAIFSVVLQEFGHFDLPLWQVVAMGEIRRLEDESVKDRVRQALHEVGLDDMVADMPDGLDTELGKSYVNGRDLSGGQWQRLVLARSLFAPVPMRILDEPTAAMDPRAECAMYELFSKISQGQTTLLITHRLGAARMANRIVVIDGEKVAEEGSHEALMAKGGLYAEMFEAQRGWYTNDEKGEPDGQEDL